MDIQFLIAIAFVCTTAVVCTIIKRRCKHEWEIIDEKILMPGDTYQANALPVGHQYVLRCKHCGKITKSEV